MIQTRKFRDYNTAPPLWVLSRPGCPNVLTISGLDLRYAIPSEPRTACSSTRSHRDSRRRSHVGRPGRRRKRAINQRGVVVLTIRTWPPFCRTIGISLVTTVHQPILGTPAAIRRHSAWTNSGQLAVLKTNRARKALAITRLRALFLRERRARDSNPQPVTRHDISSVAASHSLTLRIHGNSSTFGVPVSPL
jgi:hypothetical protein